MIRKTKREKKQKTKGNEKRIQRKGGRKGGRSKDKKMRKKKRGKKRGKGRKSTDTSKARGQGCNAACTSPLHRLNTPLQLQYSITASILYYSFINQAICTAKVETRR
jgi:hypothetical protein